MSAAPKDLPIIDITNRRLRELTEEALDLLVQRDDPPTLFVRLGELVRVIQDERGRSRLARVGDAVLRHHLERTADWLRVLHRGNKDAVLQVPPPPEVVQDLLALGAWPLPPVEAITEVPVLRADGTVLVTPGYDLQTRLVYQPAPGLIVPPIPARPTSRQLRDATDLLLDIIADFPFVDQASKANMVALLLTPIVRPAIGGLVPLALLDKPKRGTGASLLAQLVTILAFGSATDLMTAPTTEEEWRKKITAALLGGLTIIFIDNVEDTLSNPHLAAALTSEVWSDRILGRSEIARDLPQRCTWIATGNNLKVGGDLGRRCYYIRLDAKQARPWERQGFRHPNLKRYVRTHRGELLGAMLTIARGWFAAGCPEATTPIVGGFEEWTRTLGGVLGFLNVPGFLGNLQALYVDVDEEDRAWEAFFAGWYATFKDEPRTVGDVAVKVKTEEGQLREVILPDLLEALAGKGSFERKLGRALAKQVGAIFGDYRLDRAGTHQRAVLWRVSLVSSMSFSASKGSSSDGDKPGADLAETNSPDSLNSLTPEREPGEDNADPGNPF
jgi:hypothetical protein